MVKGLHEEAGNGMIYSAALATALASRMARISGRHEPQFVPAPSALPTASTEVRAWLAMARTMLFTPTEKQAQISAPSSGRPAAA